MLRVGLLVQRLSQSHWPLAWEPEGQEGDPARPRGTIKDQKGGSEVGKKRKEPERREGNLPAKLSAQRIWSQGRLGLGAGTAAEEAHF